jgi:NAD(P)-dependent dehydrogenase (short-subunit alcohol dehydrogenase family)
MPRTWLVTGASCELGREIARAAALAGDAVYATARDPESLERLADEFGRRIRIGALDVTDAAAAQAAVTAAIAAYGRLDIVVSTTDEAGDDAAEGLADEAFRRQFDATYFGVVNTIRAALPVLRAQGSWHVVNVSPIGAPRAAPGLSPAQLANWAVSGFAEVLAMELDPFGITVTALEPGSTDTGWAGSSAEVDPLGATLWAKPAGMSADPAKVADVVLQIVGTTPRPQRRPTSPDAAFLAPIPRGTSPRSQGVRPG